jgi:hypothetical protein
VAKEPGNTEFSDRLKRMRDGTEKRLEPTAVEKKE